MDKVFIKTFTINGKNEIENVYLLLEHIISNDQKRLKKGDSMTKKNQEQSNNIEKNTGFVPVQYKILKLDANYCADTFIFR